MEFHFYYHRYLAYKSKHISNPFHEGASVSCLPPCLHDHYIRWLRGVACWTRNFIRRECSLLCAHCCVIAKVWIKKNKPPASAARLLQLYSTSRTNKRHLSTTFIPLQLIIVRWALARCFGAVVPSVTVPGLCLPPTLPRALLIPTSASSSLQLLLRLFLGSSWSLDILSPPAPFFQGKVWESISCFISNCSDRAEIYIFSSPFAHLGIPLKPTEFCFDTEWNGRVCLIS